MSRCPVLGLMGLLEHPRYVSEVLHCRSFKGIANRCFIGAMIAFNYPSFFDQI